MLLASLAITLLFQPPSDSGPVQSILKYVPEKGRRSAIFSCRAAVSPDGKWLATSETFDRSGPGWDYLFRLWDLRAGKVVQTLEDPAVAHATKVFLGPDKLAATYFVKSPTGELTRGTVILSVPDLKPLERVEYRHILGLAPDGKTALCRVFTGAKDANTGYELWDWKAKKTVVELAPMSPSEVRRVSFRSDGKQVAVKGDGDWVFDTATGKVMASFRQDLWALALAPNGNTIALAGFRADPAAGPGRSRVGFWDVETKRAALPVRTPEEFRKEAFPGLHYLPDGKHLVLVSTAGVLLWDVAAEKLVDVGKEGAAALEKEAAVSFTPTKNGVYVAALTRTGAVYVWKATSPPAKKP